MSCKYWFRCDFSCIFMFCFCNQALIAQISFKFDFHFFNYNKKNKSKSIRRTTRKWNSRTKSPAWSPRNGSPCLTTAWPVRWRWRHPGIPWARLSHSQPRTGSPIPTKSSRLKRRSQFNQVLVMSQASSAALTSQTSPKDERWSHRPKAKTPIRAWREPPSGLTYE